MPAPTVETTPLIDARGITKTFPGVVALKDVDLTIRTGEIHCIVGENGAGKSTLVKVLTGLYRADEGTLLIDGKNEVDLHSRHRESFVAYVPQELDLFANLTVAENMFVPFSTTGVSSPIFRSKVWEQRAEPLIDRLKMQVKPRDLAKNIPVSDQQLLQVARALANEQSRIIILDEPTTSLTAEEIERLFEVIRALKESGMAVIFISHKLEEVFSIGDVVSVLRNGEMVGHAKLQDVSTQWIIKNMTGEEVDLRSSFRPTKDAGDVVVQVDGLTGLKFEDVSFDVKEGEVLGFAGLIGSGRSEIMETIFGYLPQQSGSVTFQGAEWRFRDPSFSIKQGLLYLTEERRAYGIFPQLTVRENIGVLLSDDIARAGVISTHLDRAVASDVMKEYDVKAASSEVKIRNLSGGNQQKVLIGRSMKASPKVLILDEPTKGIDVKTKVEIYRLMKALAEEERVAIVFISSELEELIRCSTRIIAMYQGRIVDEMSGNDITKERLVSSIIGAQQ